MLSDPLWLTQLYITSYSHHLSKDGYQSTNPVSSTATARDLTSFLNLETAHVLSGNKSTQNTSNLTLAISDLRQRGEPTSSFDNDSIREWGSRRLPRAPKLSASQ